MLLDFTISELAVGLRAKKFSSEEIVRECYDTIEKVQPMLNAFITVVDRETALKEARKKDERLKDAISPLHGLPFILKDSYITKNLITTAASQILKTFVPPYNATIYERLLSAGAILIGKTNMDAWGHGATSENNDFGPVRNPWNVAHVAGGSGGGNAAALAVRMAVFGIGEDTGGSIRNPAAWCNVVGLKVTYGRVSRYGCIAYASSFDTVGPTAKTVEDCAIVLEAIAGKDPNDATSSPDPVGSYAKDIANTVKGSVIGVPKECFTAGLDLEIRDSIQQALKVYESLGVKIREISMPTLDYGVAVYYLIAPSETSSNLGRYDGIRYGTGRSHFTKETMRRIMVGTYALSAGYYDAYYKKAQQVRTLFIEEYKKAFSQCDAILMPVTPTAATKIGETVSDPIKNMLIDYYTVTHNPVGVPSLAIPAGFSSANLPIGMQIVGKMFDESTLFRLAHSYQQVTEWHKKKPPIIDNP